jgi:predicted GIY-YIG superfamily endonuclease
MLPFVVNKLVILCFYVYLCINIRNQITVLILKKWNRQKKEDLINQKNSEWKELVNEKGFIFSGASK